MSGVWLQSKSCDSSPRLCYTTFRCRIWFLLQYRLQNFNSIFFNPVQNLPFSSNKLSSLNWSDALSDTQLNKSAKPCFQAPKKALKIPVTIATQPSAHSWILKAGKLRLRFTPPLRGGGPVERSWMIIVTFQVCWPYTYGVCIHFFALISVSLGHRDICQTVNPVGVLL